MGDTYVISGLRIKRAELAGELIATENRIAQLRVNLENIDGALRIFDPTSAPEKIRPVHRRKPPPFFARGTASRAILDALRRADAPMTAREIAAQLAADHRLDVSTTDSMNQLIAKVRNTVVQHRGGALASEKTGDRIVWRAV